MSEIREYNKTTYKETFFPLVSVIIPVYNVEKYVAKCIKSVVAQTYSNIEIIIVDDGSTDGSYSIYSKYADCDRRIVVIKQENRGLSRARNSGLKIARGDFITFIDSDDYVSSDYIEYLISLMKPECSIAMCLSEIVYEGGCDKEKIKTKEIEVVERRIFYNYALDDAIYLSACGKLYKKNIFENICFLEGILNEDIMIMYELISKTERICIGHYKAYKYLKRIGSITTGQFSEKKFDLIIANEHLVSCVINEYPDLKIKAIAYQIHARSSLIKQFTVKDCSLYRRFVDETIQIARNNIIKVITDSTVTRMNKICCIVCATNAKIIILSWKIYDILKKMKSKI